MGKPRKRHSTQGSRTTASKNENPLSPRVIISGLIVTILGGVIASWIAGEGKFAQSVPTQAPVVAAASLTVQTTITPPSQPTLPPTDTPIIQVSSPFTVQANKGWNNTGLGIQIGESIQIEYQDGLWTHWPGQVPHYGATGQTTGRYICAEIELASQCVEPMPQAQKGALIARIGATSPIYVGNRVTFRASHSGPLELGMNDSILPSDFSKDEGFLVVQITVTRAP